MPAPSTCKQVPSIVLGDKWFASVSFDSLLDDGVTITGTPTVAEVTTSAFTVATPSIYAGLTLTGMRWDKDNLILSKTGAFVAYKYEAGDTISITSGTGATVSTYIVRSKVDDNKIALASSLGGETASQADIAGVLAASTYILGKAVRPNRSITVFLNSAAAVAGTTYRFRVTVTTTENANTGVRIRDILLKVTAVGAD